MNSTVGYTADIIIVGAGAAGLAAAEQLTRQGLTVCILEARDRIGGRIHTFSDPAFSRYLEAGAEFIHGNLPVTLGLTQQAGLKTIEWTGDMYSVHNGEWKKNNSFLADEAVLISRLRQLKDNISIAEFIRREFSEPGFEALRTSLFSYVQGYYAGAPERTSALRFLEEWESEGEQQYRPATGYSPMLQHLLNSINVNGGTLHLSTVVKQIVWKMGLVELTDEQGKTYRASKAIVTIPLGVWTADTLARAAIDFTPVLPEKQLAAKQMGFGAAIKIIFVFNEPFWQQQLQQRLLDTGFIFSDVPIGTWWTQLPENIPMLTGWIAGPDAIALQHTPNDQLCAIAVDSLAKLFKINRQLLSDNMICKHVLNWTADPFTLGAYAYSTTETTAACTVLMQPLAQTLYFAGEALYQGLEMGTVEAALTSGQRAAAEILSHLKG